MEGLSAEQARARQKEYGRNEITVQKKASTLTLFLSQFPSVMNGILAIAAILSFFLGNIIDGAFILAILLINGLFGFFQEYRAQKALEKLKEYASPVAKVIRDGIVQEVVVGDITIGDVVALSEGDRIPADGRMVSGYHLEIDESILTGESVPVVKQKDGQLLRGTFVARGKGHMVVEKIGIHTRFGEIAQTLAHIKEPETSLQQQVSSLSKTLSVAILAFAFILIPIGMVEGKSVLPLILVAVSIAVAAIPESLPGVITIALAVGANRLAKKQAIVKKMSAVETLGTTQIVLTDKTGTLTQNNMQVKEYYIPKNSLLPHALESCIRGNSASILSNDGKQPTIIGEKTDGALLLWAKRMDGKYKDVTEQGTILDEYAFDARSKTISTIVKKHNKKFVFVRGAPEMLLAKSKFTKKEKEQLEQTITLYAQKGLRVIGLAYKEEVHESVSRDHAESNLTFTGLVGLYDPPREKTHESLLEAKRAGIRVVMVTGDNEITAMSIAHEVGLVTEEETAITGEEMRKLSDEELAASLTKTHVFARVSPEDKLRLVHMCKANNMIVGVTGDGVNDSLALEQADVGVAMGETGSDVAKEAADIVLANDDIYTLVRAVVQGRRIYENIITAITYLLTGNLSEIMLVFLATIFDKQLVLLPTQILWMNLVTDGWPALALASEEGSSTLAHDQPRSSNERILSKKRLSFIVGFGMLLAIIYFTLFTYLADLGNVTRARTITFTLLIISHMLLALFVRRRSIWKAGKMLWASILVTIAAQIAIATIPAFQHIFHLGW